LFALWKGWKATGTLKGGHRGLIEIIPGCGFVVLTWMLEWLRLFMCQSNKDNALNSKGSAIPSWFSSYVAEFAVPYYHWFGTCAMGQVTNEIGDDFVVDEFLRVRGISGLRVCDASVFPQCVTVPTALTCAAMGFASSEFVFCDEEVNGF
jgi:choline dehydrogenase-like flavoprotein